MTILHCSLVLILGLSCFNWIYATKALTVEHKSIRIVTGDKNCITNCSRVSAENNVFMECSVDVCTVIQTSHETSQQSEINLKKDILLEKYRDDEEDRLALYVRWSPVDNVSIKYTKGYLINITDGDSDYSTCYHFNTAMVFSNNAHDEYYNDCFGKARRTRVLPGSVITVRITSLPLWHSDTDVGTTIVRIKVPKCDNEMMHSLPECQVPGGRPTKMKCISDTCDTVSVIDGKSHYVSCDVSKHVISSNGRDQCVKVNKTVTGKVSKPLHVARTQEWYKYIDPISENVGLALNFSWMPSPDSSISSLQYYYLDIVESVGPSIGGYEKCYTIHTNLTQRKHRNATFYFDCYGRSDTTRHHPVKPGSSYTVHILSQPGTEDSRIDFTINVPNCQSEAMHDVCEPRSPDIGWMKVDEIICHNMSIKVIYNDSDSPTPVRIFLCDAGSGMAYCKRFHREYNNLPVRIECDITLYDTYVC